MEAMIPHGSDPFPSVGSAEDPEDVLDNGIESDGTDSEADAIDYVALLQAAGVELDEDSLNVLSDYEDFVARSSPISAPSTTGIKLERATPTLGMRFFSAIVFCLIFL